MKDYVMHAQRRAERTRGPKLCLTPLCITKRGAGTGSAFDVPLLRFFPHSITPYLGLSVAQVVRRRDRPVNAGEEG